MNQQLFHTKFTRNPTQKSTLQLSLITLLFSPSKNNPGSVEFYLISRIKRKKNGEDCERLVWSIPEAAMPQNPRSSNQRESYRIISIVLLLYAEWILCGTCCLSFTGFNEPAQRSRQQ